MVHAFSAFVDAILFECINIRVGLFFTRGHYSYLFLFAHIDAHTSVCHGFCATSMTALIAVEPVRVG